MVFKWVAKCLNLTHFQNSPSRGGRGWPFILQGITLHIMIHSADDIIQAMENIIGKKFGSLTVISKTNERYYDGSCLYECKCDCGQVIKTTSSRLKSGHTSSCGGTVHKIDNLIGKKFGKLTVVSFAYAKNTKAYWNCKCECGGTIIAKGTFLKTGNIVSCGCAKKASRDEGLKQIKKAFVDGTNIKQISPDRKLNSNNKTGFNGVSWSTQRHKYHAQITFKRKVYNLGFYDDIEDAKQARLKAEAELFGTFLEEHKQNTKKF